MDKIYRKMAALAVHQYGLWIQWSDDQYIVKQVSDDKVVAKELPNIECLTIWIEAYHQGREDGSKVEANE